VKEGSAAKSGVKIYFVLFQL